MDCALQNQRVMFESVRFIKCFVFITTVTSSLWIVGCGQSAPSFEGDNNNNFFSSTNTGNALSVKLVVNGEILFEDASAKIEKNTQLACRAEGDKAESVELFMVVNGDLADGSFEIPVNDNEALSIPDIDGFDPDIDEDLHRHSDDDGDLSEMLDTTNPDPSDNFGSLHRVFTGQVTNSTKIYCIGIIADANEAKQLSSAQLTLLSLQRGIKVEPFSENQIAP